MDVAKTVQSGSTLEHVNIDLRVAIELVNGIRLHFCKSSILPEDCQVGLICVDIALRMHKLTSLAKAAELVFMESFASSGHEVLWKMCFFYDLVIAVGIGAFVTPSTMSLHFPVLAHLCFLLELVLLLTVGIAVGVAVGGVD